MRYNNDKLNLILYVHLFKYLRYLTLIYLQFKNKYFTYLSKILYLIKIKNIIKFKIIF